MNSITWLVLLVVFLIATSAVTSEKRSAQGEEILSPALDNVMDSEPEIKQYPVPSSAEASFAVFDRQLATPSQKVIYYSTNYKLDFNAAKTYCESRGTSIATYEDLDGAYKDGYQKCACGWVANGIAYLVMQAAVEGCLSSTGVVQCSWQSTWDVFCKRPAPVTYYSTNYKLDFNAAKTYCESRGTSIATYEDLDGAYKDGYQKCACGWVANGIAYLVMQAAVEGCLSSTGVVQCSWQSTWDVFCKRPVAPVFISKDPSGDYKMTLDEARQHCQGKGTSLATYADLEQAYSLGYQVCNCGWVDNGLAYVVMQISAEGCMNSVGVINCSWQSTWNAFCKAAAK